MTELLHAPRPGAENLTDLLRDRWSISVFDDQHTLTEADVDLLLTAAQWSPSAGNGQPWAFFVAQRGDDVHQTLVRHLSRGNSGWVPRASAVFVLLAQTGPDADGNGPKWPEYSYYDLGQAAAHLSVQAAAMGLHSHQFAGFDHGAFAADLGVPSHYRVMTGLAVGVRGNPDDVSEDDRARDQKERSRKPLEQIVHRGPFTS